MSSNDRAGISISQPFQLNQKVAVAKQCCARLEMSMPLVVDDINDKVGHLYSGMPDRLYLIDPDGRVAYKGGRGPFGFKARELEQSMIMMLLEKEQSYKKTVNGFPILSLEEAWKRLPAAETGAGLPLPVWARTLAPSLPQTTAAMLELDYLHRAMSPLDAVLRAKMRWTAAHANECAYAEACARGDLRRAGLDDKAIQALERGDGGRATSEKAALEFARKMTLSAGSVTDAEVAQLMGAYGDEKVVAMVLLLAYANFQDRLILSLGIGVQPGEPLGPQPIKFVRPRPDDRPAPRVARGEPNNLDPQVAALVQDSAWQSLKFDRLQAQMSAQREREPRILVPTWDELRTRLAGMQLPARPVRIRWSLVCMGYQPRLAMGWSACTGAFGREAQQDRVFEESLFWVVTRTLHCFY
jgi:alkylhydroperoxidase family enzyme